MRTHNLTIRDNPALQHKRVFTEPAAVPARPGTPPPVAPHGSLERAKLHVQHKRYGQALDLLRQAIVEKPEDAEAHALLGMIFLRFGMPTEGHLHLNRALALDPHQPVARTYLPVVTEAPAPPPTPRPLPFFERVTGWLRRG